MRAHPILSRLCVLVLGSAGLALGGCNTGPVANYLYMVTNPDGPNAIEVYRHDLKTGQVTRVGRYPTGGQGAASLAGHEQQAVVTNGTYLYAVNPGSNSVSAFRIETDGSLFLLDQEASGGQIPVTLTLSRDLLYVGNAGHAPGSAAAPGSYRGFRVQGDGSLQPLNCPLVDAPVDTYTNNTAGSIVAGLALNADATLLVASVLLADKLESFRIDSATGCLSDRKTIDGLGGPFGTSFRPGVPSQVVVSIALPQYFPSSLAPGVAAFNIDAAGTLTQAGVYTDPDKSDTALRDPCWATFAPDGQRFWTSSFIPRSLNLFEIDGAGQITRRSEYQPGDTVPDPSSPNGPGVLVASEDIAVDPQGRYLYQLRASHSPNFQVPVRPRLEVFEITADPSRDAGLRPMRSVALPADLTGPAGTTGLAVVQR